MRRPPLILLALLTGLSLSACGDDDPPRSGPGADGGLDARLPDDGPLPDRAPPDGPLPDGPLPDGSTLDGPLPDGPLSDGPLPDGPLPDGPLPDGAIADAGPPDADPADALPPADAGADDRCAPFAGLQDQALLTALHARLQADYQPIAVENDLGGNPNRYTTARFLMFTEVELIWRDGALGHACVYTGRFFPGQPGVEPDHNQINCEHTWPRSRMAPQGTRLYEHQQSDIHHLLPTVNRCNSLRGSFHFGDPVDGLNLDCMPARLGRANGQTVFAPQPDRKGDVARVVLYFAARWGADVVDFEEAALRRWHAEDPVDERERARNAAIEALQGNRNPFIDCPQLVEQIDDFRAFPILDQEAALPGPPG